MAVLRDERISFNVRKQLIYGIKQRVVVKVVVRSPTGATKELIGYSSFELMRNKNDRDISTIRALWNAIIVSTMRYGFPTGTYIYRIIDYGFQSPKGVTVKRVSLKGNYRTMVYSKGRRGAVKNVDWSYQKDKFIKDVADEEDLTPPDRWRE